MGPTPRLLVCRVLSVGKLVAAMVAMLGLESESTVATGAVGQVDIVQLDVLDGVAQCPAP